MDDNSLNALFSGLTSHGDESQSPDVKTNANPGKESTERKPSARARQRQAEEKRQEERFCTIVKSELLKKRRIIATREGLQIKDVVEAAFEKAVSSYERKHGKVEEDSRKDAKDLF